MLPQHEDPDQSLEWGPQPLRKAREPRSAEQAGRLRACALLPTPPF